MSANVFALSALAQLADLTGNDWRDQALCAQTDPNAFFPEKGGSNRPAKATCRSCPVRAECLQYALDNDEPFGVWGGMTRQARQQLAKQQRDAA